MLCIDHDYRMRCLVCSHDNDPAVGICVQCGASLPSATSRRSTREQPVYLARPRRHGIAFVLISLALVLGAAVVVMFRLALEESPPPAPRSEDRTMIDGESAARGPELPAAVEPPLLSPDAGGEPNAPDATAPMEAGPSEPSAAEPPATRRSPAPPTAAAPGSSTASPSARASRSASPKGKGTSAPDRPSGTQRSADASRAAMPKAGGPGDRWTRMSQELASCAKEDLLARIICVQRVRWKHCDGYWGSVPQCPGARQSDYTP